MVMKNIFITTKNGIRFKIVKEEDDPLCNRLSIGGIAPDNCYIVFRGNMKDCGQILEAALEAFKIAEKANQTQNN